MQRRTFLKLAGAVPVMAGAAPDAGTEVSIRGEQFLINGKPTYAGRSYRGIKVEGLLMNVRAVQAIFDDLNPATCGRWAYPDTGNWDPERNVREFLDALPKWRRHGVLAFTVNLQGGSPEGYSKSQPWENTAIRSGRQSAADLHEPARPRAGGRRSIGYGGDRRLLLLRAGSAGEGRAGGKARRHQCH